MAVAVPIASKATSVMSETIPMDSGRYSRCQTDGAPA